MKGILFIVLGVVLTLMSLMLLLVERWALVGIALGILAIVYGRKEWKSSREIKAARAASKQQAVIPDAPEASAEAAPAPAPAEMDAASKQHDPEPKPERTFSQMETHRIAGTSFHESEIPELMIENGDYDMTAAELIDAGFEDERVYKYSETYCTASLEPEPDNQYGSERDQGPCGRRPHRIHQERICGPREEASGGGPNRQHADHDYRRTLQDGLPE